MTDYAGLKAEIALPQYAGMTDAQIAAALLSPIPAPALPFAWKAVKTIVQVSGTWSKVVLRSRLSDGSAANLAAINSVETDDSLLINVADPGATSAMSGGLGALLAAGDITLADVAAINALMTPLTTTRAAQLGLIPGQHDPVQEIAAARRWGA